MAIDEQVKQTIDALLKKRQYEDLLFVYSLNYKVLIPFFDFLENVNYKDRIVMLEYILCSRGASTLVMRKIINSSYFYTSLSIDKFIEAQN